jgi:hypothetical protein
MAKAGSGNPNAGPHQLRMEDQRPLALLRRLLFETEEIHPPIAHRNPVDP